MRAIENCLGFSGIGIKRARVNEMCNEPICDIELNVLLIVFCCELQEPANLFVVGLFVVYACRARPFIEDQQVRLRVLFIVANSDDSLFILNSGILLSRTSAIEMESSTTR